MSFPTGSARSTQPVRTFQRLALIVMLLAGSLLAAPAQPAAAATNLALGRPALASSVEAPGTVASLAVDGNLGSRWSSAFADPQWLRIDLGSAQAIGQVVLRWEAAYGR